MPGRARARPGILRAGDRGFRLRWTQLCATTRRDHRSTLLTRGTKATWPVRRSARERRHASRPRGPVFALAKANAPLPPPRRATIGAPRCERNRKRSRSRPRFRQIPGGSLGTVRAPGQDDCARVRARAVRSPLHTRRNAMLGCEFKKRKAVMLALRHSSSLCASSSTETPRRSSHVPHRAWTKLCSGLSTSR